MKQYVIMIMMFIMMMGCAPKAFKPEPIKVYKSKHIPEYVYDFSKDAKPQPLKPVYLDAHFKKCDPKKARYLAFSGNEFNKVKHLQKIAKYYKNQLGEHVTLINIYIKTTNSERDYTKLENRKAIKYQELWMLSEDAYRRERWYHKVDNWINRLAVGVMGAGLVYVVLIAL